MRALWRVVQVGALMLHVSAARGQTEPPPDAGAALATPVTAPPPPDPAEPPNTAPSPPPAEPAEPPPPQDLAHLVHEPALAPPAEPPPPASKEGASQQVLGTPTPAAASKECETSTPSPPDASKEWGARRATVRRWHSRYGVTLPLNQVGSGTRFYTGAQRVGMWTNFEFRILPCEQEDGMYLGLALQIEYESDKHSPYNSGVRTELMIWEALLRVNAGFHWDFDNQGLSLYIHAGGGGQRLRGRAWSPGEPVLQAVQHGLVRQTGVGSIFSFFHNRLELVLEGGVEKSAEITLQSGERARAFLLPPLDPSSYYLQTGLGLGF
jgi:hypothetical protein